MSHYDRIISSMPVNKTAARVTSQPNHQDTEKETLVKQAQHLHDAIKSAKKLGTISEDEIYRMGVELQLTQKRLKELKEHKNRIYKSTIEFYFIEACRDNMNKFEFNKYLNIAMDNRDKAELND